MWMNGDKSLPTAFLVILAAATGTRVVAPDLFIPGGHGSRETGRPERCCTKALVK